MFASFLTKLFGEVKFIKIFTDLFPGFILALSGLLILGSLSGEIHIFPFEMVKSLEAEKADIEKKITAYRKETEKIAEKDQGLEKNLIMMEAWIKQFDKINAAIFPKQVPGKVQLEQEIKKSLQAIKRIHSLRNEYQGAIVRLAKEHEDNLRNITKLGKDLELEGGRIEGLDKEIKKRSTIKENFSVFEGYFAVLILFSFLFGPILSQVTRTIFVNNIFQWMFKWSTREGSRSVRDPVKTILQSGKSHEFFLGYGALKEEDYQKTVSANYNYMESGINFIIPLVIFAYCFGEYLKAKGLENYPTGTWGWISAMIFLLVYGGYYSYKRHKIKVSEFILGGIAREGQMDEVPKQNPPLAASLNQAGTEIK